MNIEARIQARQLANELDGTETADDLAAINDRIDHLTERIRHLEFIIEGTTQ